jgi:CheY-specific phosphatase CheX
MGSQPEMPSDAQPIDPELEEQLRGPFVAAVQTALLELAQTEAAMVMAYQVYSRRWHGELIAALDLVGGTATCFALGFSLETAAALARRMLSETLPNPDDALIRDCVGEIANVAAGQAKALLHGTPSALSFGIPRIAIGGKSPGGDQQCLIAVMATDVGEVAIHVFVR